jgi:hypothetical protein
VRLSSIDREIPNLADLKLDEEELEDSDEEEIRKINHLDKNRLSTENVSARNISKIISTTESRLYIIDNL